MNNSQRGVFFNVDWILLFIYLLLCAIGWFNIHAAVFNPLRPQFYNMGTDYGKELMFLGVSLLVGFIILLLESRVFTALAPFFYGGTVVLLLLVLVHGRNVGGNQSWIELPGGFRLQPSEFAKLTTILLLARYLSGTNIRVTEIRSFLIAGAIIFFPMLLIKMQPDDGSTLVFCSLIFVLYREGLSPYFLIVLLLSITLFIFSLLINQWHVIIGVAAIGIFFMWMFRRKRQLALTFLIGTAISIAFVFAVNPIYKHVLKPHQKVRIDEMLGINTDLKGAGYNVNQSKIAIGSGRLWGKGYMQGTQTRYAFVPEQSTDFIFCTIGEEWGFAGAVVVIGLYVFLLIRLIILAERQRSPFSRVYMYGIASVIFFHFFINISMTIGFMPVIGIPLPMISYGGSSLLSFTIMLFIALKLDSNRMGII